QTDIKFNNDSRNSYIIEMESNGVLFNGSYPPQGLKVGSSYFTKYNVISLINRDMQGTLKEVIIPFTDLNYNEIIDEDDLLGDSIVINYTCTTSPFWYKDADGDGHASDTLRSCDKPGEAWTLT